MNVLTGALSLSSVVCTATVRSRLEFAAATIMMMKLTTLINSPKLHSQLTCLRLRKSVDVM